MSSFVIVNAKSGERMEAINETEEYFTSRWWHSELFGYPVKFLKSDGWIRYEEDRKMKLEVYKERKEEEKTCYLELIKYAQFIEEFGDCVSEGSIGDILLIARNGKGRIAASIVAFKSDGTFIRCTYIDKALGFKVDDQGRIKEST